MKKVVNHVTITGNERWLEIKYSAPEDEDEEPRAYFIFRGREYFMDEIMNIHNTVYMPTVPEFMKGFDGYDNDVLIKLHESGDSVKAYNFY